MFLICSPGGRDPWRGLEPILAHSHALPGQWKEGYKHKRESGHRTELDLETLVFTRGRAFPLSWLASRLKCPRCGCWRVAVVFDATPIRQATTCREQTQR